MTLVLSSTMLEAALCAGSKISLEKRIAKYTFVSHRKAMTHQITLKDNSNLFTPLH